MEQSLTGGHVMDIIPELIEIVGPENVFDDRVECLSISRDLSVHEGIPDVVVFAFTTEQISAIMQLANEKKIPVTVQGSGTATTGASLPVEGGILLDLHRMNTFLKSTRTISMPGWNRVLSACN